MKRYNMKKPYPCANLLSHSLSRVPLYLPSPTTPCAREDVKSLPQCRIQHRYGCSGHYKEVIRDFDRGKRRNTSLEGVI